MSFWLRASFRVRELGDVGVQEVIYVKKKWKGT